MKQYPFPNNHLFRAGFALFLFVLLLLARDTLITSVRLGFYCSQFLMLAFVGFWGIAFLAWNRRNLRKILCDRRILLMLAYTVLLLGLMVIKRDWQIMYFSILLCLLFPVFLTFFTDTRRVSKYYVVILTALGIYSVIATYLFRKLVWNGYFTAPIRVNDAGMEFLDFILCFAVNNEYWHRNFGIFREPGVYQFFLLLGLFLNHYRVVWRHESVRWGINLALAVVMVTTFSIGGLAELGLLVLFVYFDMKYYRTRGGRILGICGLAAFVVVIGYILYRMQRPDFAQTIFYEFYDMFIRLTTESDSLRDRLSAIFTDVGFFLKNPVVGAKIAPVLHGTNHNTSSTLLLFAVLGGLGGALHLLSWMALLWNRERHFLGNLILLGIFLMSFNTQNLIADVFFWLFPCMALTERGLPKLRRKEKGTDGSGIAAEGAVDTVGNSKRDQAGL